MLEKWIRPAYQRYIIQPIMPFFSYFFTPCQTTIIGGVLGLVAAMLLPLHHFRLATLLLLLSGIFDTLDGSLARYTTCASNFGCVLDIFTDRIVEAAIVFGLFLIDISHRAIPTLLMLISIMLCVTSFLAVGIFASNDKAEKSFFYSAGLIERLEAFVFFIAMIWLPHLFIPIAYLFSSLVLITSLIRLNQFRTSLKR
jgi:phosphatidylglycerophosphate synthase